MNLTSRLLAAGLASVLCAACATAPETYERTEAYYVQTQMSFGENVEQIEVGRPVPLLDGLNHYVLSLPVKLLLLNWHVLDHELAPEDRALLEYYFELNQLTSVKVRHNQYAPVDELRRLIANREVGAPYRYTLGLVSWLQYTLIPDRLFAGVPVIGGGDHFNPFSNTIHVYSSDLAILLHEAGHAKDYVRHESKGTGFVLPRLLPGIDLLQEAAASSDAIRFLYCIREGEREVAAYRSLIPAYSTYIAGYFQGGLAATLPVVAGGHVSAWFQARERAAALASDSPELEDRSDFLPDYCVSLAEARERQNTLTEVP